MQPFISVLVPVYNVEEYVEACLDSLLAQDFEDFEAIVIDDGSTDGSAALVDHYASSDSRVRVIHKENAGYGAALNLGLAHAKGEYIAILESDDVMCVHALAHMAHIARTHHIDSYHGGFRLWWSASNTLKSVALFSPSICGHVFDPREDLRCYITMPSLWAGLYRRVCIESAHISFWRRRALRFRIHPSRLRSLHPRKAAMWTMNALFCIDRIAKALLFTISRRRLIYWVSIKR